MKKQFSILMLLVATNSISFCQQMQIGTLNYKKFNATIHLPLIKGNNQKANKNINDFLQINYANTTTIKTAENNLFDNVVYKSGQETNGYMTDLDFTVKENSTVLSIVFLENTMAAYPDFFEDAYTFNTATGDVILLQDIFTENGLKTLTNKVIALRKKSIQKHIATLKKDKDYNSEDDIEPMFTDCEKQEIGNGFYMYHDSIFILHPRCLPHVAQALDGNFEVGFSYKELATLMNSYGKSLLIDKKAVKIPYHASIYNRPLKGFIDKYPITMFLLKPYSDNELSLYYYYENEGKKIELNGTKHLTNFNVSNANVDGIKPTEIETLKGEIKNNKVSGTWLLGNKSLKFSVQ